MQTKDMRNRNRAYRDQGACWNLEDLYRGADDPEIEKDLMAAYERALDFFASYKGKLLQSSIHPEFILAALRDYETIHDIGKRPCLFAYLYHSEDTEDPERNGLLEKVEEAWNNIWELIAFFELEIMAFPEDLLRELASGPYFTDYRHFFFGLDR